MKRIALLLVCCFLICSAGAQTSTKDFQFAQITDLHIGGATAADDLRRTVKDINGNDSIAFVILTGDITEFGSDAELLLAKQILDSLNKPWHIIPGNHDTKWSESGGNSFRRVFGSETFAFIYDGFLFVGTNSGPNMRMGPGQIPVENIVWLDSVLVSAKENNTPVIYANHYPAAEDLNNWYEAIDRLKSTNIQLALCGHGHVNKQLMAEGIPCIMSRSNLRAKNNEGGYNVMHVYGDTLLTVTERKAVSGQMKRWASVSLYDHHFADSTNSYPRPDFSVNNKYPQVREVWRVKEKSDIGAGVAMSGNIVIATNTGGSINAYDARDGRRLWQFATGAKIYSTPVITGKMVIETSTDGMVYALSLKTGRLIWKFNSGQPSVASPSVVDGNVFISGSWGKCYLLGVRDGKIKWVNEEIKGFVETIPVLYKGMILFGTWANHLYSLDVSTGNIVWDWKNDQPSRMLSPAACIPVATGNRVFVVAPDRKMACIDAQTGKTIWHSDLGGVKVRESMGVSADSSLIFAKTMNGEIIGVSTDSDEGSVEWKADINMVYDIAPSAIYERDGTVFVPSDKGFIYAIDRQTGKLLWSHRISSCLVNHVLPLSSSSVICTAMDGVITVLSAE